MLYTQEIVNKEIFNSQIMFQESPDMLTVGGLCYEAEAVLVAANQKDILDARVLHDFWTVRCYKDLSPLGYLLKTVPSNLR